MGALFIGGIGGCDNFSCNASPPASGVKSVEVDASWARKAGVSAHIPATARSVFFARDLATVAEVFQFIDERLPVQGVSTVREAWKTTAGFDPFEAQRLAEIIGLAPTAPAAIFYDRGYWVLAAEIKDNKRVDTYFKDLENRRRQVQQTEALDIPRPDAAGAAGLAGDGAYRVEQGAGSALKISRGSAQGGHLGWLGVDGDTLLAAVRVEKQSINADDTGLPETWRAASKRPRFVGIAANQKLLRTLSPQGPALGIVRPAAWLAGITAHGHANTLLKRLLSQVGPVGIVLRSMSLDEGIGLRILTPGNPRAPAMIDSLGKAHETLAAPEGLVEPGVLAVGRLSVDPRKLYELFVSLLPAEQRDQIAEFWEQLDRELSINALRDVLDNLQGHAVLVAYGLDPDGLDASAPAQPWYLRALKLQSTREALLLPIKEREPLELVLDALTTVSKGKLSRQVAGPTIQYAWLAGGELKWAVILGDAHLIYVDSAVAFEHARAYERGARPMDTEFDKIGISRLFAPEQSAGLYVDTASLGGILSENRVEDAPSAALGWLKALNSVVVTIQEDGAESGGVTDVYIRVASDL